jgi:hypothetical protein
MKITKLKNFILSIFIFSLSACGGGGGGGGTETPSKTTIDDSTIGIDKTSQFGNNQFGKATFSK